MKKKIIQSSYLCAILATLPGALAAAVTIDAQWLAANAPSPYYLDTANETYTLAVDVSTPGTAFAITAGNVTFDLGGRTITYGDAAPIIIPNGDFETSGGWDLSGSAAEFAAGTFVQPVSVYSGARALRFQAPLSDQSIRSLSPVLLQPNTTYTLSAMFYNYNTQGNGQAIRLFAELEGTSIRIEEQGITYRGFQYRNIEFTTGPAAEWRTIRLGVANSAGSSGPVYIDDVRIQRTRNHGVVIGVPNWQNSLVSDMSQFGNASSSIVHNGSVQQGQGRGDWSHGVLLGAQNQDFEASNLSVYVYGANSRNIHCAEGNNGISIHDNVLTSDVRTITSRDMHDGIMVRVDSGGTDVEIYNNTLSGGPQGGIRIVNSLNLSLIYGNTISLRGLYSNGFALLVDNAEARGNTINCHEGVFACRGIMLGDDSYVYDNVVNVRYLPENQEYNGCSLGGTYGIQSEGALNSVVSGNVVTAYSDECEAVAFRINDHWQAGKPWGNSDIFNNEFVAVQGGPQPAYTFKASNLDEFKNVLFHHNTLRTNSRWILGSNVDRQDFISNTFSLDGQYEVPMRPFIGGNTQSSAVRDILFVDSRFGSAAARDAFREAGWRRENGLVSDLSSHIVGWDVEVLVRDGVPRIAGAQVSIRDNGSNTVFSGTTDSEGVANAIVDEYRVDGFQATFFGPFQVESQAPQGFLSETVAVDNSMTVVLNYGPPVVDLGLGMTADRSLVRDGDALSYVAVVENHGSEWVGGAQVTDLLPSDVVGVGWTCVASGGGSCSPVGAGDVVDTVDLPPGAILTYTITGTVSSAADAFDNTGTVAVPGGVIDTNAANDADTATVNVCGQDNVVLSGYVIDDPQVFVACETVTAGPDFRILAGGDVSLHSGTVILGENFSVAPGGTLTIQAGAL